MKAIFKNESTRGGGAGLHTIDRSFIEIAYIVTTTLTVNQCIIKKTTEERVEKVQAHVTTETIDQILQKELEVKKKAAKTKVTFKAFIVGEAFWISFGICTKRKSKSKMKLEDGIECMRELDFKESKSVTKGCASNV
jgi:hypothetical protein